MFINYIMNYHKFIIFSMLKYHLQFWCLVIYKPFLQVSEANKVPISSYI